MTKPCTYCRYERIDAADPHTVYDCLTRALDQRDAAELQLNAMRQERDDEREISKGWEEKAHESNRLNDELKKENLSLRAANEVLIHSESRIGIESLKKELREAERVATKFKGLLMARRAMEPKHSREDHECPECEAIAGPVNQQTEKRKCEECDGPQGRLLCAGPSGCYHSCHAIRNDESECSAADGKQVPHQWSGLGGKVCMKCGAVNLDR